MTRTLTFCCALVLAACGDDDGSRDAGPDAARADATVVDGGPISDAAGTDARVDATDAAGPLSCEGPCDPVAVVGTCDAGFCVLAGSEPSCVSTGGGQAEGEPCDAVDPCAPGLACFLKREGGTCGRVCCPTASDGCRVDEHCGGPGVLFDGTRTTFRQCLPPRRCNVLGDACEPMEACYIVDPDGGTDCRAAGTAPVGAPCERPNDCAPGLACTGLFERTCVRVCSLTASAACPPDEGTCVAYAQSPEGTGLCTPGSTRR